MSKDFFISVLRGRGLFLGFLGSVLDPLRDLGVGPNPLNHSITRSKKLGLLLLGPLAFTFQPSLAITSLTEFDAQD